MPRLRRFASTASLILIASFACYAETTNLRERDIAWLQSAMREGTLSSESIVQHYLDEIARIDKTGPTLNSVIELNPDALAIARRLDDERANGNIRGALHGIPVMLKANIDTGDRMATSAGSLALADHIAPDDAFLVQQLRAAGVVILGKTNLSEWANFRSSRSSSGWSSAGGQTRNPYNIRRNPCGSSSGSGVAVAANLTAVAIGTETWGSIICPSGINGIVGIKPTVGLVSRDGIIPISHTQDTAGPMARTVRDAATLLNAMVAEDPNDPAMAGRAHEPPDYTSRLSADALHGVRIGVLRNYSSAGEDPHAERVFASALKTLASAGAVLVDPIEIDFSELWEAENEVLYYEFKADLNAYLQSSNADYRSLKELIRFNEENSDSVMPIFGQEEFITAEQKGPLSDDVYVDAVKTIKEVARSAIDNVLAEHEIVAIVAPTNSPSWLTDHVHGDTSFGISSSAYAAISGYAGITVPAGFAAGLPVGLTIFAGPFSEKKLIDLAYAFEQAGNERRPPEL